jgi:hypothetical protein
MEPEFLKATNRPCGSPIVLYTYIRHGGVRTHFRKYERSPLHTSPQTRANIPCLNVRQNHVSIKHEYLTRFKSADVIQSGGIGQQLQRIQIKRWKRQDMLLQPGSASKGLVLLARLGTCSESFVQCLLGGFLGWFVFTGVIQLERFRECGALYFAVVGCGGVRCRHLRVLSRSDLACGERYLR